MKGMKAREIRALLATPEFEEWYRRYVGLREALREAQVRREDALVQAGIASYKAEAVSRFAEDRVFKAGEVQDLAAQAQADVASIENRSLAVLSAFEAQRLRTTELWVTVDRLEKNLEDARQRAAELRTRAEALEKTGSPENKADAQRFKVRLEEIEATLVGQARTVDQARERYNQEMAKKERLWLDVEEQWSSSFRTALARSEYAYQARRVQREAEAQFQKGLAERRKAQELTQKATALESSIKEQRRDFEAHVARARQLFGATLVEEFLFWPQRDEIKATYVVPLIDEPEMLNIEVRALHVYQVDRDRGLEFVEPITVETSDAGFDPRLEGFFITGRPRRDGSAATEVRR